MKKNIFILLILVFFACSTENREKGNGLIITHDHQLEKFSEVVVNGNFEILLKKSSVPLIKITTDENLHPLIEVQQQGDIINITAEKKLQSKRPILITIGFEELLSLTSNGTSVIKNEEQIKGEFLKIEMAGAGTIDLNLDVDSLKATISGAGAVQLEGKTDHQFIEMTGAGGLEAYDFISKISKIDISGVGGAAIFVQDRLEASVSGVGGISYKGNPKEVVSNITGLGTIKNVEKER